MNFDLDLSIQVLQRTPATLAALLSGVSEPWTRGKPFAEIRVRLKSGANLTLGVLARNPELVLVRTDEKLQYHLRSEAAKRLFAPPAAVRTEPATKK